MSRMLESLIEEWQGLGIVTRFDRPTGTWMFLALHDDTLGTPVGGTRIRTYASPADGLRDAMRLAEGMTHKWAAIDLDSGGGKGVLAIPGALGEEARRNLFLRYGALIESLGGLFSTGRDLGTTDDDMRTIAEVTTHVHGVDPETGATRDPAPFTARGVLAAMRATFHRLDGSRELAGRVVLVQGVGSVGHLVARELVEGGARVLISDVDDGRIRAFGDSGSMEIVPPDSAHETECDLYAPCAVGGTVNRETIPALRCRAVVGSANNQLGEPEDADRLHTRGILYAPDFVANGGGALGFGLIYRGFRDERELATRVDGIEGSLSKILDESARRDESPLAAARRLVARRLSSHESIKGK